MVSSEAAGMKNAMNTTATAPSAKAIGAPDIMKSSVTAANVSPIASSDMPSDISEYGIQSGGAHDDDVVCLSTQASCSSVHDFHANRAQKARQSRSTPMRRSASARFERSTDTASMPTWPRIDCTNAPQR